MIARCDRYYPQPPTNPDGGFASLANAISVTNVLNIWMSEGPFWGFIKFMVMHTQAISTLFAYVEEVEVYRTLDTGVSWENVLFIPQMGPLALKPDSGDVLLAVVDGGLMRSIDTGDNWQQILTGYFTSVAYGPGPQYPIFAAIRDSVRVSADDGLTWEEPGIGLPEDVLISSIATHPVSDSVAYLSNFDGQLFTTIDGGVS